MDLSEPLVQTSSPNASLLEHDFNHVQGEESPRREVHGDDFEHQPPSMENSILSTGSNDQVSLENFLVPQISFPGLPNQTVGLESSMTSSHHTLNPNGTSLFPTIFLIVNAALGAGLLNFPKAFEEAGGVVVAMSIQIVLLAFIIVALVILAYTADQNLACTIQEAMESAGGKWARRLTAAIVVIYCFGTTITFLIIIGDQFDGALASLYGVDFCHHWYMNRAFTICCSSIVLILPLCYSKKIDFLRIPSMLGVFAILYIVALIAYEYFMGGFVPGEIKTHPSQWTDVFLVVPDICFGYQCHVSVIPIYSCMKHRTIKQFSIASITAIVICAVCYSISAIFGYLTFGSLVDNDILLNFDASRPEVLVAIVAMALKTYTTYPILLFCGREAIRSLLLDAGFGHDQRHEVFIRSAIATTWFALSLALSVFIPDIGGVIKILGSFAAVFIFVIPGFGLFTYVNRSDPSTYLLKSKFFLLTSIIFLTLGTFIFGVVLTQAVRYNMVTHPTGGGDDDPHLCVKPVSQIEMSLISSEL